MDRCTNAPQQEKEKRAYFKELSPPYLPYSPFHPPSAPSSTQVLLGLLLTKHASLSYGGGPENPSAGNKSLFIFLLESGNTCQNRVPRFLPAMMLDQCIPEGDLALMKWLLGHIRHIIRPSLPGWLAFTCVSAVPKKKLNRRRGGDGEGERGRLDSHSALPLWPTFRQCYRPGESKQRACSRTALRRAAQRREGACSIDRALGDRTRDASYSN